MNASLEDITKVFSHNRFEDGEESQFNLEKEGGKCNEIPLIDIGKNQVGYPEGLSHTEIPLVNYNKFEYTSCLKIVDILKKNQFPEHIVEKINPSCITVEDVQNVGFFNTKKKKKSEESEEKEEGKKKKRGRKKNEDKDERKHDKNKPDNMMKKCKGIFFSNMIDFTNEYSNQYKINYLEDIKLLKLDYNLYIKTLKKDTDLKLLKRQLKDLASLNTSTKYTSNEDPTINKKIIDNLLEVEKDNKEITTYFNMTFDEWVDIFTMKKKMKYNFAFDGLKDNLVNIWDNGADNNYFSRLIFYLYNYKNWFLNKRGRERK